MSSRKNPAVSDLPKMDKHEEMLNDMHSALYSLSDKIRKPHHNSGDKLLPSQLQMAEKPEAKAARKHINKLHRAMREEK